MADTSIYQQAAGSQYEPTAGPFTGVLTAGLHPAQQQSQQEPYSGGSVAGVLAMIGDRALQGIQRGRFMRFFTNEIQSARAYNAGLSQFDLKRQQVIDDPTLTDEDKQAKINALDQSKATYVSQHFNTAAEGIEGGGKGKGKKSREGPPTDTGAGANIDVGQTGAQGATGGPKKAKADQESLGRSIVNTLGGALKRVAGPNLPPTQAPMSQDWVKARLSDVDQVRAGPAQAGVVSRQTDLMTQIQEATKDAQDREELSRKLQPFIPKILQAFPRNAADVIGSLMQSRPTPEVFEERKAETDADKMLTASPGPLTKTSTIPEYLRAPGQLDTEVPLGLPPDVAQSPLAKFYMGQPQNYTPRAAEVLRKKYGINQPTWYLQNQSTGDIKEIMQITPVMPGRAARFIDQSNGYEVNPQAAQNGGWNLLSERPYKPNVETDKFLWTSGPDSKYLYRMRRDAKTGKYSYEIGPDGKVVRQLANRGQRSAANQVWPALARVRRDEDAQVLAAQKELSTFLASAGQRKGFGVELDPKAAQKSVEDKKNEIAERIKTIHENANQRAKDIANAAGAMSMYDKFSRDTGGDEEEEPSAPAAISDADLDTVVK